MESCENISSFVTEDKEIEDKIYHEKPKITGKNLGHINLKFPLSIPTFY